MNEPYETLLSSTRESVERMKIFSPSSVARVAQLGEELSFKESVPDVEKLVGLYKKLPMDILDELAGAQLQKIEIRAQHDYGILEQIENFKIGDHNNPTNHRHNLQQEIENAFLNTFEILYPYFAFGLGSQSVDVEEQKQKMKQAEDDLLALFDHHRKNLKEQEKLAKDMISAIREASGEASVEEQSKFFEKEAGEHNKNANYWQFCSWLAAAVLVIYAGASVFFTTWLNEIDAIQLAISKALIFIVLGYALFFCARNYAAHRHNAIVNRHRHNALSTYRALVEANHFPENADIVLAQAARYIYAPQDSGYVRRGEADSGGVSVFEAARRATDSAKKIVEDK